MKVSSLPGTEPRLHCFMQMKTKISKWSVVWHFLKHILTIFHISKFSTSNHIYTPETSYFVVDLTTKMFDPGKAKVYFQYLIKVYILYLGQIFNKKKHIFLHSFACPAARREEKSAYIKLINFCYRLKHHQTCQPLFFINRVQRWQ